MSIRIILVDDHTIVREGLKSLLASYPEIQIVGEASSGRTTIKLVKETNPDLVVMDISMPDMNGIQATRLILKEQPSLKIIALSMYSDRRFVTEMLNAGASGYLLKECALEELASAIKVVLSGRTYISQDIANTLLKEFRTEIPDQISKNISLSQKETSILIMIADGMSTRQIAEKLNVSLKTVETHRHNIMEKIGVKSVAELTKYAVRLGLVSVDK